MGSIVDKAKERDKPYKESGVQYVISEPLNGIERIDLDSRRVAGADAIFGSYDYFGSNHDATDTNPSVGPYWRMQELDSLDDFLEDVRDQRASIMSKHNSNTKGTQQFVHYMEKTKKVSALIDIYNAKVIE